MRVCLFEDRGVTDLEPLTLTRPAFELLCGASSLASRQCHHFAPCEFGVLVRSHLADLYRLHHPSTPVNDLAWLREAPTVLVNGRWLAPADAATDLPGPLVALAGDEVAYAVVGRDQLTYCSPNTLDECLEAWKASLPTRQVGGRMIRYPWMLVERNAEQLRIDFASPPRCRENRPGNIAVVGTPGLLRVDPTARVDPFVVADTTDGPVVIEGEAVVTAFTRLEGPCYVGPQTHVLGAKIRGGTTLGPNCRIGGEVEASIVHGHTNKYHDGFLGHSYLGEWVNLGAGTQNSDLRNDYGEITVRVGGRPISTGMTKVGCFLGDHTKTGLGTLLNTGTCAGAFCNLLPSGNYLPKWVPSFCSWWNGALQENSNLAQLLGTAARVMERRGSTLTEVHAALFRLLFAQTTGERQNAVLHAEQHRLRRSA
jgi:UDP-N-acetylglucosamine diphosphorylase/glucosamine-1-phosphate N-acetyltransferase